MPSFEYAGAHIYYEEFGKGFPILTFAPAGLASVLTEFAPAPPAAPTTRGGNGQRPDSDLAQHRDDAP